MRPGPPFTRVQLARPAPAVARDLIGAYLLRRLDDGTRLLARIVEVEAYLGDGTDPGSHAHRGPTPRNRAMFGPPGRLYVYRSYGIHVCANVVCGPDGRAAAVLLRGIEPLEGIDRMRRHRGLAPDAPLREVGNGPGKLGQALALRLEDYGANLRSGAIVLRRRRAREARPRIGVSTRVGLSKGADLPYRFFAEGHPCVSRARPGPRRG